MSRHSDAMRLTFLAEKLDEMRTVSLERTLWEEGSAVNISGPLHSVELGSSEPFITTMDALRSAIDNAMDEESEDNARSDG